SSGAEPDLIDALLRLVDQQPAARAVQLEDAAVGFEGGLVLPEREEDLAALEPRLVEQVLRDAELDHGVEVVERLGDLPLLPRALRQLEGAAPHAPARVRGALPPPRPLTGGGEVA